MKTITSFLVISACFFGGCFLGAQPLLAQGEMANVVVTAESKHDGAVPEVTAQDLRVREDGKDQKVTAVTPLRGSITQLLILLDDSAGISLAEQLNGLKDFINSLPPYVQVGVGYMQSGMSEMAHGFTSDHAAAAKSVRLTLGPGGADVSPYDSLSDAVKKWPTAPDIQRKMVLMISSGIEALGGGFAPENPYVNKSIRDAQRAGVLVYGIYNPSGGHFGHTLWRITYGQNLLSQLTDETGGESYIQTFGPAVDFGPYYRAILGILDRQYLVTFTTNPEHKSEFESLSVRIREKDADITAPSAIYVKK